MSAFEYATALALTAVTLGGAGLAGWGLRHRLLGDWSGAPAALATALAGLATLLLGAQLLGLAGLLNRPGLAVLMVAVGAAGAALRPWRGGARTLGPRLGPWAAMSCALGCGVVAAVWLRRGFLGFDVGMGGTDTLWFHMPFASAFAQSGSITALLHTDTQFANAFYPANSELLHATGMVLFGSDVISPLLNVAFLALLMLAGWCAGGPRGVAPVTCLGAAALAVLPTLATTQPGDAKNDTLALACMAAAVAFLLNGRGRRTPVALAGLAAGIAVGTKLSFAVPAALLLVAVPACVPRGRRASAAAVWTAAAALPAAVWFARNLAATGNPLPYVRHLGPIALPGPPAVAQSDTEFAVAHYLGHGGVWDEFFLPGLEYAFGPLWWLVLALAVAALLAGALRGAPTERGLAGRRGRRSGLPGHPPDGCRARGLALRGRPQPSLPHPRPAHRFPDPPAAAPVWGAPDPLAAGAGLRRGVRQRHPGQGADLRSRLSRSRHRGRRIDGGRRGGDPQGGRARLPPGDRLDVRRAGRHRPRGGWLAGPAAPRRACLHQSQSALQLLQRLRPGLRLPAGQAPVRRAHRRVRHGRCLLAVSALP